MRIALNQVLARLKAVSAVGLPVRLAQDFHSLRHRAIESAPLVELTLEDHPHLARHIPVGSYYVWSKPAYSGKSGDPRFLEKIYEALASRGEPLVTEKTQGTISEVYRVAADGSYLLYSVNGTNRKLAVFFRA